MKRPQEFLEVILIFLLILLFHYLILQPVLGLSLQGDDWLLRLWGKKIDQNHLNVIFENIKEGNLVALYQMYHIYFLEHIWGYNVQAFQITNIFLKSLAAISVYLLIRIVFNKLLAFFAVILFTIGYTAAAPLEWIILGGDYLSITMISLFFLAYYFSSKNEKIRLRWALLLPIPFLAALSIAPARVFPILLTPILIEAFLLTKQYKPSLLKYSLIRLGILYLPLIFLAAFLGINTSGDFNGLNNAAFINSMLTGNWQNAIIPLQGIGFPAITPSISHYILGKVTLTNFHEYFLNILGLQLSVFLILTLFLSFLIATKPILFALKILVLNFLIDLLIYIPLTYSPEGFASSNRDVIGFYPAAIGVYIIVISFVAFTEWLFHQRKNINIVAIWGGPIFSLLFVISFLFVVNESTSFAPIHRYLIFSSLGIYLFMAGLLNMIIKKFTSFRNRLQTMAGIILVVSFLVLYFQTSREIIADHYNGKLANGRSFLENEVLLKQMRVYFAKYQYDITKPALFLFDASEDPRNGEFYEQGFLNSFTYWIYMPDDELVNKCSALKVSKVEDMKMYLGTKDGQVGFQLPSSCVSGYYKPNSPRITNASMEFFYPINSFYAFKLQDRKIFDIRDQALMELGVNN